MARVLRLRDTCAGCMMPEFPRVGPVNPVAGLPVLEGSATNPRMTRLSRSTPEVAAAPDPCTCLRLVPLWAGLLTPPLALRGASSARPTDSRCGFPGVDPARAVCWAVEPDWGRGVESGVALAPSAVGWWGNRLLLMAGVALSNQLPGVAVAADGVWTWDCGRGVGRFVVAEGGGGGVGVGVGAGLDPGCVPLTEDAAEDRCASLWSAAAEE